MIIYRFEDERLKLKKLLKKNISCTRRAILICDFYSLLIETKNINVIEAFYPDFLEELNQCLPEYDPFCLHPDVSRRVLNAVSKIAQLESVVKLNLNLASKIIRIQERLGILEKILIGEDLLNQLKEPFFPSIETVRGYDSNPVIGFIDKLKVKLSYSDEATNFIVIPTEKIPDKRILSQINISWNLANEYCSGFIKGKNAEYDVIISFDKKFGSYAGESFGAALIITFINRLLEFHNLSLSVGICPGVALTGAFTEEGIIKDMGKEIIEKKTECLFYSDIETFVIPENDLGFASARLKILNKYFPERKLDLIGIGNLWDMLDRRRIVEIIRKNLFKRTANFFSNQA